MKYFGLPLYAVVSLTMALGCANVELEEEDESPEEPSAGGGKMDLPNDMLIDRDHDGSGYAAIANHYADEGFEVAVDLDALAPLWPMAEETTALLNRFGTPIQWTSYGYFHTALDVYRADPEADDAVVAPFAGTARVFDWWGTPGYSGHDYGTVIAVWDPASHVIAQLMHVRPTEELTSAGGFVEVEAGQVIGHLADDLTWLAEPHRQRLRHTHADLIDGGELIALNPARYFPYHDTVPPVVLDAYLLDESAEKWSELRTGEMDVVLEVFDRDDDSDRNFEAGSIAYEIVDDQGNLLAQVPRCEFAHLYESIETTYSFRALSLLDFGNARDQVGEGHWPSSDIDDLDRTFRYALTQLTVDEDGRCDALTDDAGFVTITDEISSIEIRAWIWDHRDNLTEVTNTLTRAPL